MKVIDKLREDGIQSLTNDLGIKVKDSEHYILLDYCQINSPKDNPIVKECRGLILEKESLKVVCRSFDRFFNFGESGTGDISFDEGMRVVEKVDGSLIRVWYSDILNKWVVSTRGTIFADSDVNGNPFTFTDLFVTTFVKLFIKEPNSELSYQENFQKYCDAYFIKGLTFIFEIATPYNRVVTSYSEDRIVLLAIRDNEGGGYANTDIWELPKPNTFPINSFKDCLEAAEALQGLEEGFVVIDSDRVPVCKIKSPKYVMIHHMRAEGLNPKRISQLVWAGEQDEYLSYYPEDADKILPYVDVKNHILLEIHSLWNETKYIEDQKEFALQVKDSPYSSVLFQLKKGRQVDSVIYSIRDEIKKDWLFDKEKEYEEISLLLKGEVVG